ncbi:transcriptional repressor [Dyella sp. EPa41]|uniref:Fur family transcriptional regulator n=1 Tax=Dyella sp. EPa41 TaxID=1561194 RepID=UPI00191504E5|nr:transcriptional repressor [Dyella sp. EPa41]
MPECAPAASSDARSALAQAGLRATPPRLAIWQVLHETNDEPDAVAVLRRAQLLEPRTSLGTVYRFLRELELLGLASSRPVPHERARWKLGMASARHGETPRDAAAMAAVAQLAAAFGYMLVPATPPAQAR